MLDKRARTIKTGKSGNCFFYWMNRDIRVNDNPALKYAQELASENNMEFKVFFCLTSHFPSANLRSYYFLIESLKEVEKTLSEYGIKFILLKGNPDLEIVRFINNNGGTIVTDFNPVKVKKSWLTEIKNKIPYSIIEVDAHNMVPAFLCSDKEEYGARTIRKKIWTKIKDFEFDPLKIKSKKSINPKTNWQDIYKWLKTDNNIKPIYKIIPGEKAALKQFKNFIKKNIKDYNIKRNNPIFNATSELSPYLHFGNIGIFTIYRTLKDKIGDENVDSFLEEIIVRKELSDNYVYYNENYDNINGIKDWARKTLIEHTNDNRDYIYSLEDFERGKTHDKIWNFAQKQLLDTGKIHGYLRMYWAKKILEWSENAEKAIKIGIYLNDKYALDGRDPNGYVGILWSIGGLHDRAWTERKIFGKIRYMNSNGIKRKFPDFYKMIFS